MSEDLENLELGSTPKLAQAARVSDANLEGVHIPIRFSIEEALAYLASEEGNGVVARTEHTLEIPESAPGGHRLERGGVPGLLDTRFFKNGEALTRFLEAMNEGKYANYGELMRVNIFSKLLGLNPKEVLEGRSYSLWEEIQGENGMIAKDKVVEGRYHIIVNGEIFTAESDGQLSFEHLQLRRGEEKSSVQRRWKDPELLKKLIHFHEQMRGCFPEWNGGCNPVEFQLDQNGNLWFLQIHQGAKLQSDFKFKKWASPVFKPNVSPMMVDGSTLDEEIEGLAFIRGRKPIELGNETMLIESPGPVYTSIMARNGVSAVCLDETYLKHREDGSHGLTSVLNDPRLTVFYSSQENPTIQAARDAASRLIAGEMRGLLAKDLEPGIYVPFSLVSDGRAVQLDLEVDELKLITHQRVEHPRPDDPKVREQIYSSLAQ